MWKVAKYKIYGILQNKVFIYITILLIVMFNYKILKCGILLPIDEYFTVLTKYELLIGNYINMMNGIVFIVSIFLGVTIIDDDIESGKINIMLISFKKRWKYLVGNFIGIIIITFSVIIIITVNYLVYASIFKIGISFSDLINCNIKTILNMAVVTLVASLIALVFNKKLSIFITTIGLFIFNIYTYNIIPVIEKQVYIKMHTRRLLAMLFPITHVYPESIYSCEFQSSCIVNPYIFDSIKNYQIIYIVVITLALVWCFDRKEI